jgi:hypothetical protein
MTPDAADHTERARFWRALGAGPAACAELLSYATNHFDHSRLPPRFPVPDEPFVEAWQRYREAAEEEGVIPSLRQRLVQLRFPVRRGISETELYRRATRRGVLPETLPPDEGLALVHPRGVRLVLHQTPAGRVPVLIAEARPDFVALVQALAHRNEPVAIPAAMGACIVSGLNNWDRIAGLRRRWEETPPQRRFPPDWEGRFREIVGCPPLYQDRVIILSCGPYSATAASALGLGDEEWSRRSLTIRLEHECTHYFTRQVLGSMRNEAADELIADYMGIVAAEGRYRADWFLRFVGLEDRPRYRCGARLESYRGSPPLSDAAFAVLQRAVALAADNLARCDELRRSHRRDGDGSDGEKARTIIALTSLGLEALAGVGGPDAFWRAWQAAAPSAGAALDAGNLPGPGDLPGVAHEAAIGGEPRAVLDHQ